jgi:excisionase family DNA binding protein
MQSLLTIPEVAARLSINRARAYELVRRGVLPAVHLGRQVRVDARALEEFSVTAEHRSPLAPGRVSEHDTRPGDTKCRAIASQQKAKRALSFESARFHKSMQLRVLKQLPRRDSNPRPGD